MDNNIKKILPKKRADDVKNKVSIPQYFDKIIVPQLGSYYDVYPVNFDNKPVACCPLHDEDTPSFRYYEDTSSFYCFGCQKGGNIITLHRYFTEALTGTIPDYDEAVNYLFRLFVENLTDEARNLITTTITKDKKSTDKELLAFSMYRVDLEGSINADRNIKEKTKQQIYKQLDTIDILIDKDLVNATEAKAWIKNYVRQKLTEVN